MQRSIVGVVQSYKNCNLLSFALNQALLITDHSVIYVVSLRQFRKHVNNHKTHAVDR
jgi:hypothetical protein